MEPKAQETCWRGAPRSMWEISALVRALLVSRSSARRSLTWSDVGRTLDVSRDVASEFKHVIFTLVERQMDIAEGHRLLEQRATCAELVGKHLVATCDK